MEAAAREYIALARQMSTVACYDKALDYYLSAFESLPALRKSDHVLEFRSMMNKFSLVLMSLNKIEEIFCNYSRVLKVLPDSVHFVDDTGRYLFKFGFFKEAWAHFVNACKLDPFYATSENNFNLLKNMLVERWHFRMLNDKVRNEGYRAAIHETIVPVKDTVLDLGTGTGLLALYANECSPVAITACDGSEVMASVANYVTQENGAKQVEIIQKMSTNMSYRDIGGKRSLLITEMFDAGLFGEHILQTLSHAWEHLINNVGRVIPNKAEFFVIGAQCDFLNKRYQLCSSIKSNLNIPTLFVHGCTQNETYDCEDVHLYGEDIKYITQAESVVKINFNNHLEIQDTLNRSDPYEVHLTATQTGELNSVIGFFNLYLTDTVTLTSDPRSDKRANAWQQAIFFDNLPKQIKEGDAIKLEFLLNSGKLTLLPEYMHPITRISPNILRFLNDTEYIKMISGSISMASVYLGQVADMTSVTVVDLCPFPMLGLQLLKRGAKSLICSALTNSDKQFFLTVFHANNIPMSKVTVLVGQYWPVEMLKDKYHVVFCNILEPSGEVDLQAQEVALHLRRNHVLPGGLFLPSNLKIMGQIVDSHWLDINNRLYDENVNNYKIAKYLNHYQMSQHFCIDFSHLPYVPLSEPSVMWTWDSEAGLEILQVPITKEGVGNAILCWYSIELMENMNEISTNRKNCFMDGMLFITDSETRLKQGDTACVIRCVDYTGAFKLMMQLEET